jgi:acyl carrier protein
LIAGWGAAVLRPYNGCRLPQCGDVAGARGGVAWRAPASIFLLALDDDKLAYPMRTIDQTTQEILDLASKHFNVPAGTLAPDDDFFKKLGIDSLQTLELLSRIENHFNIELPDYEVQGVSDFRTLASRIQSRL